MNIVIAGTGPVSPIGIGNEIFQSSILAGSLGIRMSEQFKVLCGEVSGAAVEDLLKDRRFRRAASFSRFALLAVKLAIQDAGRDSLAGLSTALVMATMHGALNYTQEFHRAIVIEGVEGASPILFSDSVLNAASGNVSLCFGIKGSTHTIIGGQTAFIKAIQLGSELLFQNEAETVIIAASEELNEIEMSAYSRLGAGPLAEGSGALLLTRETSGDTEGCVCIRAASSFCDPADSQCALQRAVTQCLASARLHPSKISMVLTDSSNLPDMLSAVPTMSVSALTGQAFASSAAWHVIAAVLILRGNSVSVPEILPVSSKTILICSEDAGGVASAVIVSRGSASE